MRHKRQLHLSAFVALAMTSAACSMGPRAQIKESALAPKTESTKIFAADGSLITTLQQEENRETIPLGQIPQHVRNAVVAIEDSRFYGHGGIDAKAILRALFANASSGKVVEGGSTITQQLVRNALSDVGQEQTLKRKLKEASYAYNVDQSYAKDRILELYLNTVYFGEGAYGVQTASRVFFGKDVKDISLAEGALLAGLIRSPINHSPRSNADKAIARRNLVLKRMVDNKFVTPRQMAEAREAQLHIKDPVAPRYQAPYFVDYLTRLIQRSDEFKALGADEQSRGDTLFRRGLRIYSTLDPAMQAAAEQAVSSVLNQPGDPSASFVAIDPKTFHVKALIGGKDFFAGQQDDPCVKAGAINADGSPKMCARVNLALGQGGGGSGRQGGSSFKPFVLASALEHGMQLTDVYNAPSCIDIADADAGGTKPWHVCNYEEESSGSVSVQEGTYRSINTVYAQIINDIGKRAGKGGPQQAEGGAQAVVETAERMGLCQATQQLLAQGEQCKLAAVPSAALGANAVSTLDMTSAFATLPSLGAYQKPTPISKITDAGGKVLWEPPSEKEQALSPAVAHLSTTALQDVITKGTGARFGKIGRPAFGKTGTAQEWRDAWFVGGAGTDLVAGVSVFWPDGEIEMKPSCRGKRTQYRIVQQAGGPVAIPPECRKTRIRVAGGTWPTQIWAQFMTKALESTAPSKFPVPSMRKVEVAVDAVQGCLPHPDTPKHLIATKSFFEGTQPTAVCQEPTYFRPAPSPVPEPPAAPETNEPENLPFPNRDLDRIFRDHCLFGRCDDEEERPPRNPWSDGGDDDLSEILD